MNIAKLTTKMASLLGLLFSLQLTGVQNSYAASFETQAFPVHGILKIQSNPSDQTLEIDITSLYPNGCYMPFQTISSIDSDRKEIKIYHFTKIRSGICTMALRTIKSTTEVLLPADGEYQIVDAISEETIGRINIDQGEAQLN